MTDIEKITQAICLNVRMILEYGGETYRAEETARYMGEGFGMDEVEVFALPTGIMMTVRAGEDSITRIVRVHSRGTDLKKVNDCNSVSRSVRTGQMDADAALEELRRIEHQAAQPMWVLVLAGAVSAAAFCMMFGGGIFEIAVSLIVGMISELILTRLTKLQIPGLLSGMILGFIITLFTLLCTLAEPRLNIESVISGSLMPLLPGLAMTSAIRDTIRGDLVSGGARVTEAILTAFMLAAGAGIMLSMWKEPVNQASVMPSIPVILLSCAIATAAFGFLLDQPARVMWIGPAVGTAAYLVFVLVGQTTVAYFAAAMLICLVGETAARLIKCTATMLITASVIPLVPGVGLYRTMLYLTKGEYFTAADTGAGTLLGILSIALAITVASLLFVILHTMGKRKKEKTNAHTDHK